MFNYIVYNTRILNCKPHIAGTRLSVEFTLELVASGATKSEILKAYPQLTAAAIEEAIRYATQDVTPPLILVAEHTGDTVKIRETLKVSETFRIFSLEPACQDFERQRLLLHKSPF